jgi:hypothetical protein
MRACNSELLFLVATEFVALTDRQKLNIGMKLNLIDFHSFCFTTKVIEETVFTRAYQKNKIADLVKAIQQVKLNAAG